MKPLKILSFFIFPAVVFLISLFLGIVFDAFNVFTWMDIPMHFVGGLAISFTAVLFLKYFQEKKMIFINERFVFVLIVVSLVSFAAVLWEFYEFFLKVVFEFNTQPSLADTMLDFFMGLCGGLFGGFVFRNWFY